MQRYYLRRLKGESSSSGRIYFWKKPPVNSPWNSSAKLIEIIIVRFPRFQKSVLIYNNAAEATVLIYYTSYIPSCQAAFGKKYTKCVIFVKGKRFSSDYFTVRSGVVLQTPYNTSSTYYLAAVHVLGLRCGCEVFNDVSRASAGLHNTLPISPRDI